MKQLIAILALTTPAWAHDVNQAILHTTTLSGQWQVGEEQGILRFQIEGRKDVSGDIVRFRGKFHSSKLSRPNKVTTAYGQLSGNVLTILHDRCGILTKWDGSDFNGTIDCSGIGTGTISFSIF